MYLWNASLILVISVGFVNKGTVDLNIDKCHGIISFSE